jgi:hypothetical protein
MKVTLSDQTVETLDKLLGKKDAILAKHAGEERYLFSRMELILLLQATVKLERHLSDERLRNTSDDRDQQA